MLSDQKSIHLGPDQNCSRQRKGRGKYCCDTQNLRQTRLPEMNKQPSNDNNAMNAKPILAAHISTGECCGTPDIDNNAMQYLSHVHRLGVKAVDQLTQDHAIPEQQNEIVWASTGARQ